VTNYKAPRALYVGNRTPHRPKNAKKWDTEGAKNKFVELMNEGILIGPALETIGYARKTYEEWRRKDKPFAERVDIARQLRQLDRGAGVTRGERLGFAEWREKYLKTATFWHQLQWVDLLEGREPRDLHPAQTYEPGKRNRLLVNCPPFHAKSMTLTIDYCTYRLCLDPAFRILIVSAGAVLAGDFLYGIKQRLTSPDFLELQKAYAPEGGCAPPVRRAPTRRTPTSRPWACARRSTASALTSSSSMTPWTAPTSTSTSSR
jgi:hypothetical protein